MSRDYVNFGFDEADVIVSVGYELQEFDPVRINPKGDKQIIHLSRVPAEVDVHYDVTVGIQADIGHTLDALAQAPPAASTTTRAGEKIRRLLADELARGASDDSFPLKPQRVVADTRAAWVGPTCAGGYRRGENVDGRLYPRTSPTPASSQTDCRPWLSHSRRIGAKLAAPDQRVLAVMGDGAFLMNSQELETAIREHIPLTVLIWEDEAYGLIGWKMDIQLGHHMEVGFSNPDFVGLRRKLRRPWLPSAIGR